MSSSATPASCRAANTASIAEPDAPLGVADGPGVLPDADPTVAAFDDDPGLPPEPDVVPDPEPDPLP